MPLDILDRWQKWKSTFDSLRVIEIPRWCKYTSSSNTIDLLMFSQIHQISLMEQLRIFQLQQQTTIISPLL